MPAIGGSIESMSIDSRSFPVAADAGGSRGLGGFKNEVASNGNGTARLLKTRVPWMHDGLTIEIDDNRGDQEFLKKTADSLDFVPITFTYASGFTWSGTGTIIDDINYATDKATADIKLSGPGDLTAQ